MRSQYADLSSLRFFDSLYLEEVDCLVHNVIILSNRSGSPGAALGCLERHDGHLAYGLTTGGQAGVESGHLGVKLYL